MKTYEQFNKKKPEVIKMYHKNGQKESEIWILKDKRHREDGPANQRWFENGQKNYEEWYLNDKRHRENGPAVQWWYENGQKSFEDWYLDNKNYSREEWIDKLKEINSPYYEEQLALYNAENYNL